MDAKADRVYITREYKFIKDSKTLFIITREANDYHIIPTVDDFYLSAKELALLSELISECLDV